MLDDVPAYFKIPKKNRLLVANAGLYYVAYRLSLLGWHVLVTSRNTKGVDLIAAKGDWAHVITVQVKASSKQNAIILKGKPQHMAAYYIVATNMDPGAKPKMYIFPQAEFAALVKPSQKPGFYTVESKDYAKNEYENVSRLQA